MPSDSSFALFSALLADLKSQGLPSDAMEVSDWPGMSYKDHCAQSIKRSLLKKFKGDTSDSADAAALEKFLLVNKRVGAWTLVEERWSHDDVLLGELKRTLYEFWNDDTGGDGLITSFDQIWSKGEVGPGAAIGAIENDFYSKLFSSPLTTTSMGLYRSYRSYIDNYPEWANAENIRLENFGSARIVEGNRLRYAPKNRDISRVICVEPNLNMFGQLGIGNILAERCKRYFGIDLSDQPEKNRELARIGSKTGQFSTIDLASASDSLSIAMLEYVLPSSMMSWLRVFRSKQSTLLSGEAVALEMVSTMGNGYTFPLQTVLFASIVVAAARARGFKLWRPHGASLGSFGVFGDDIIVPTYCHYNDRTMEFENYSKDVERDVLRLLALLGFEINYDKSFFEGPFRESCGGDFFQGLPSRGVYIKDLRTMQDRFVALNVLTEWAATTGIPLKGCAEVLLRTVKPYWVPAWENYDAGICCPGDFATCRRRSDSGNFLYKKFIARTRTMVIGETWIKGRKGDKLVYNMSGLLISFLKGTIRSGKISCRDTTKSYRAVTCVAPNWDYPSPDVLAEQTGAVQIYAASRRRKFGDQQWNTAARHHYK